jgi:hypothetical protein
LELNERDVSNQCDIVLTEGLDVASPVRDELLGVEFVNSKHDSFPSSLASLLQHVSSVQKPTASVLYYLINDQKDDLQQHSDNGKRCCRCS